MNEKEMKDDETGMRFQPTEVELVNHYLKRRVQGLDSKVNVPIAEVKVLQHEPWDLRELSKKKSDDPFCHFFNRLVKYKNSERADRRTKDGYWKVTGSDREVKTRDTKQLIGIKKTLVYVSKKVRGQDMNWVIHEYHLTDPKIPNPHAYVICCLKKEPKKQAKKKANGKAITSISVEGECSHQSPSDIVNHVAENTILEGTEACLVHPPSQTNLEPVELSFEEGISLEELFLSNDFSSDPPSQTNLEPVELSFEEGISYEELFLSNDFSSGPPSQTDMETVKSFNSDTLSQADLENAYFKLLSLLNPQQGPSYQGLNPLSNAFYSDPPSQVDLATKCQNLPLSNGSSNVCNVVQTQAGTTNECETYPEEAINWGAVGMSSVQPLSAQPLESISATSYCEDGGMSNDANNEEAITQAREAIEHVIDADLSPELSHNSTQHVTPTHLSPQLSHNSDICMDFYIGDSNEFVSQDLSWL